MMIPKTTKEQHQTILAVTFGNILEWFEVYLFVYWAPVLSSLFFNFGSDRLNLIGMLLVFGVGFITRPLGALFFGHLGDMIGRKKSFVLSITVMTLPTLLMGFLPTYAQVGIFAPILLGLLRLLQSFPAGGESPGAFCYLYENADSTNKKYMSSWGAVGNQIGAIFSILESILMERFLGPEFLLSWGWRIAFFTGGLIGLFGIYLRSRLHETHLFTKIKQHHKISKETISHVITNHKKSIFKGVCYCAINASTFYLIASYVPDYLNTSIQLNNYSGRIITIGILAVITILLPFFGILGDKLGCKKPLIGCSLFSILLLVPLYVFLNNRDNQSLSIIIFLYMIPVSWVTALIPYLLTDLFPTPIRFTCVGLSFNLADGMIGGFTPAIVLSLVNLTGNQGSFCGFVFLCSLISLISYMKIKD